MTISWPRFRELQVSCHVDRDGHTYTSSMQHLYGRGPPDLNNSQKAQSSFSFYEPPVAVQGSLSLFTSQSPSCALNHLFPNLAFGSSL